jgi:glycerol-3-phosphate acyltransferase PlsY
MNMLRTLGFKFGVLTLILDAVKGFVPALLAGWLLTPDAAGGVADNAYSLLGVFIAGLAVIVGHMFPVIYKFRGGKSVASGIGVFAAADWRFALPFFIMAAGIFLLTHYGSVASMCCTAANTAACYVKLFVLEPDTPYALWVAILLGAMCVLIFAAHRKNILRLIKGTEPQVRVGKRRGEAHEKPEN